MTRESIRLSIRHPLDASIFLVGVLEKAVGHCEGRKIALILHGTMGHKDYLFQKRLAQRLTSDSFRFDFRGNHESGGQWKEGGIHEDVEDLEAVVAYLKNSFGYVIDMLVGHSRGSVVALRWMCTAPEAPHISAVVNVSGRYRMEVNSPMGKKWHQLIQKHGYVEWSVTVARKDITVRITAEDWASFRSWNNSHVWDHFPPKAHVLSIHGLADQTVPPYDALIYTRALTSGQRTGNTIGTTSLNLVEGADHNFTGRQDEVVDTIIDWLGRKDKSDMSHSNIWIPDEIRSRL
ncbi:ectomycorrhiza-regulated esterase [Flagelloscypha sp. PMI_526]|nr:ectomycorrhiza-regulated esterase [Flagelloscypha sp. PMI_526]